MLVTHAFNCSSCWKDLKGGDKWRCTCFQYKSWVGFKESSQVLCRPSPPCKLLLGLTSLWSPPILSKPSPQSLCCCWLQLLGGRGQRCPPAPPYPSVPAWLLTNSDVGSRVTQPGVSAIPMRHSLEKLLRTVKNESPPRGEWASALFKKIIHV